MAEPATDSAGWEIGHTVARFGWRMRNRLGISYALALGSVDRL
jgi:hypothetical protein